MVWRLGLGWAKDHISNTWNLHTVLFRGELQLKMESKKTPTQGTSSKYIIWFHCDLEGVRFGSTFETLDVLLPRCIVGHHSNDVLNANQIEWMVNIGVIPICHSPSNPNFRSHSN